MIDSSYILDMLTNENILDLEIRNKIFNHISKNPGLHFNEMSRTINIPKSTLHYHLDYLQKKNIISSKSVGKCKRYFIFQKNGVFEKKLIHYLRQEIPRKMIMIYFGKIAQSCADISQELGLHPNTISFHINKLLKDDMLEIAPYKKGIIYIQSGENIIRDIAGNPKFYKLKYIQETYSCVIENKNIFKQDEVCRTIVEFYDSFFYEYFGKTPKVLNEKTYPENDPFFNLFFEMFPHPYHA